MDAIEELLTRGVDKIYPSKAELEKVLRSGKKLRLYQGFDPTGPQLHIGHAVTLRKLRQFQDLGHHVIFLIGDFTGMIGDPTGKLSDRKILTKEKVLENAKSYKNQASKILRFEGENAVEIKYNSEWLGTISALEFLRIANLLSVQQVVERDMFQERQKKGQDVFMNEFLYPVLQAYDSVAMNVDMELGGTDQMFNMLMGRKLMRHMLKKEKFVMTTPLLTDSKGVKIGKSEGNVIGITDPPTDFYGKIMALGDDVIVPGFTLLTDTAIGEIGEMKRKIEKGEENPMIFKKQLAFELTRQFNDETAAQKAQDEFERVHQKGEVSTDTAISVHADNLLDALVQIGMSKSEGKRLIEHGGVEINGTKACADHSVKNDDIIKVGKKKFVRIHLL